MIFAYNSETLDYIGGLVDTGKLFDREKFQKEFSVIGKRAVVVECSQEMHAFVKQTDLHRYPIFPITNLGHKRKHAFTILGCDYGTDCSNVVLSKFDDDGPTCAQYNANQEQNCIAAMELVPSS